MSTDPDLLKGAEANVDLEVSYASSSEGKELSGRRSLSTTSGWLL
jgi:hypothetical protein